MHKVTIHTVIDGEKHEELFCKINNESDVVSNEEQCAAGYFVFTDCNGVGCSVKLSRYDRLEIKPC